MRVALIALVFVAAACGRAAAPKHGEGSADNGRLLLRQFGCGTCHEIPGVADARGRVGPPLEGIASRVYIAGRLPNSPANLAAFIREPQRFEPRTAMPDLGVSEPHARDMAAYLGTLE